MDTIISKNEDSDVQASTKDINEQVSQEENETKEEITKTRKDLHMPRRIFHFSMGLIAGMIYKHFLTHAQAVHILGVATCVFYILEQIRINYPENRLMKLGSRYLLRAEEQLKESASMPYLMGLLLTILTFPKTITLVAVFTLAVCDPLSAIIGIRFGKTKLKDNRSLEGTLAFLIATVVIHLMVLLSVYEFNIRIALVTICSSLVVTAVDFMDFKIDDNLTIPLSTAGALWLFMAIFL
ncbi:phosphatidate cytidylyltransferase-like protein [Bacteriovorax sp. BAL6_X]|uniref:diacylglycerol/polyprenol kinase family protein n=1 Tax=Bacteriovorax sp. BAL6_X TaxID=1201290 RepID=UPI000386B761|nr:diacylglycerol/polyprenol kinase family protein [Bacteriovorax sp. BAL6_X]EPZ51303.1 phosphatidate cytidylyltransferase-like protein [Bacteriovorax sp. BAL6_X]